jgi:hypothetical protein
MSVFTTVMYETTLEELGKNKTLEVEVAIELSVLPGDAAVKYYPEGSGYPGSPTEVEIVGCRVEEICGNGYGVIRENRLEYFELLDEIVLRIVQATLNPEDLLDNVDSDYGDYDDDGDYDDVDY